MFNVHHKILLLVMRLLSIFFLSISSALVCSCIHLYFVVAGTAGRNTNFILLFSFRLILLLSVCVCVCTFAVDRLLKLLKCVSVYIQILGYIHAPTTPSVLCCTVYMRVPQSTSPSPLKSVDLQSVLSHIRLAIFGLLMHNRTRVDTCRSLCSTQHTYARIHPQSASAHTEKSECE